MYKTTQYHGHKNGSGWLKKLKSTYFSCAIANTHEKLAKHLNIDQICIDRKAFLVESKGASIGEVVNHVQTFLEKLQRPDNVADNVSSTSEENSTTFYSISI